MTNNISIHTLEVDAKDALTRGQQAFIDLGKVIDHAKRLFAQKGPGGSYGDWCNRIGVHRSHADRIHRSWIVIQRIAPVGAILPPTERHCRPLTSLPEDMQVDAWREALKESEQANTPITPDIVEQVCKRYKTPSVRDITATKKQPQQAATAVPESPTVVETSKQPTTATTPTQAKPEPIQQAATIPQAEPSPTQVVIHSPANEWTPAIVLASLNEHQRRELWHALNLEFSETVQTFDSAPGPDRSAMIVVASNSLSVDGIDRCWDVPEHLVTDEFASAWAEWIDSRRKFKARGKKGLPITQRTITTDLNLLSQYEVDDAVAILDRTVERQWQGLVEGAKSLEVQKTRDKNGEPLAGAFTVGTSEEQQIAACFDNGVAGLWFDVVAKIDAQCAKLSAEEKQGVKLSAAARIAQIDPEYREECLRLMIAAKFITHFDGFKRYPVTCDRYGQPLDPEVVHASLESYKNRRL